MRVLAASIVLSLFVPTAAQAFCRTTTEREPNGYDPSRSGCFTTGTALAWHGSNVAYVVDSAASTQVSLADARATFAAAFAKWSAASCSAKDATKHPNISVKDNGTIASAAMDCGLVECDPTVHDTTHAIVFRDDAWPHNDPNNTLALTTVTFGVNSGEIFDADMEINTHDHFITTKMPTPSSSFDLETIVTHEAGHFIGLAHSDDASAVMFVRYQSGRDRLTADDELGVCTVYPPGSASSTKAGCACDAAGGGSGAPALAFGALVVVALRRRRRANLRSG